LPWKRTGPVKSMSIPLRLSLSNDRHLLDIQFITSLKWDLCTGITKQNTAEKIVLRRTHKT
jgi:hypothetical protein